jgi:hypothetical protein
VYLQLLRKLRDVYVIECVVTRNNTYVTVCIQSVDLSVQKGQYIGFFFLLYTAQI